MTALDRQLAAAVDAARGCEHPLLAPESKARGYCEACRRTRGEPMAPYDYRRIPNPGPKLRAAMDEMDAIERAERGRS